MSVKGVYVKLLHEPEYTDRTVMAAADTDGVTPGCVHRVEHELGDYIKIGYLSVLFFLGASINVAALERLCSAMPAQSIAARILHRMKINMNVADLLIIFVFTLSDLCWMTTYDWRAGDAVCRMVNFGRVLAFYISSNLVVCIAMNRYYLVFPACGKHSLNQANVMLLLAWIIAILCSVPQLFIWTTTEAPICPGDLNEWNPQSVWRQCCTIWDVQMGSAENNQSEQYKTAELHSSMYNAANLIVLFWVPFALICYFYLSLIVRLPHKPCCHRLRRRHDSDPHVTSPNRALNQPALQTESHAMLPSHSQQSTSILASAATTGTHKDQEHSAENDEDKVKITNAAFRHARNMTIRVSLFVSVVYCVSFMPYVTMQSHKIMIGAQWYIENAMNLDWLNALIVLHSVLNPFMYGAFTLPIQESEFTLAPPLDDGLMPPLQPHMFEPIAEHVAEREKQNQHRFRSNI